MRWKWFLLVAFIWTLVPIGFGIWSFVVSPLDPGYGGCEEPIFMNQMRFAQDLSARMDIALLIIAIVAGVLVFESYYFQLLHGMPVLAGNILRYVLCVALAAAVGLGFQYYTYDWVLQDPSSCLYSALMNYEASRLVPLGGQWMSLPWATAMRIDFAAAALLGGIAGSATYATVRTSLHI